MERVFENAFERGGGIVVGIRLYVIENNKYYKLLLKFDESFQYHLHSTTSLVAICSSLFISIF